MDGRQWISHLASTVRAMNKLAPLLPFRGPQGRRREDPLVQSNSYILGSVAYVGQEIGLLFLWEIIVFYSPRTRVGTYGMDYGMIILCYEFSRKLFTGQCTLWKADRSPACRAVMMALDAMNLSITEVDVNMDKAEHRSPEMLVMNPLQTLPVFKDKQLIVIDSHAICSYLAARYCNTGALLPLDPGGKALVDQQLHYNSGVLYPRFRAAAYPLMYDNCNFVMPQQVCDIECSYADLESMLVGRTWFGGSWPTLGDIALAATMSTLHILVPIDKLRYPRISGWLYRMTEQPYYITANKKGLCEFTRRIGELTPLQKT